MSPELAPNSLTYPRVYISLISEAAFQRMTHFSVPNPNANSPTSPSFQTANSQSPSQSIPLHLSKPSLSPVPNLSACFHPAFNLVDLTFLERLRMTNASVTPRSHSRFQATEDAQLSALVAQFGTHSWQIVASRMPGRSARQCRDRWKEHLSDSNSSLPWTPEEDAHLIERIGTLGPLWTRLASSFANRTPQAVKRRWAYLFTHRRDELRRSAVQKDSHRRSQRLPSAELRVESVLDDDPSLDWIQSSRLWDEWFRSERFYDKFF
jgi:hypothetical protein